MRIALGATLLLWILIIGLIYLCFPGHSKADTDPWTKRTVIKIRTYWKPGYHSLNEEQALATARIAIRRTERLLPVRFSHSFRELPIWVAPYELDYEGCYRVPELEGGKCCPMEYIQRYWEESDIWLRNKKYGQVSMVIAPPVGGNPYHNYSWLSGGIALKACFGQNPNISIGIVNATDVNIFGESRIRAMSEVYRHELHHTAFNAKHREKPKNELNVMSTFSPEYNLVEAMLMTPLFDLQGIPTSIKTLYEAGDCIDAYERSRKQKRGKK